MAFPPPAAKTAAPADASASESESASESGSESESTSNASDSKMKGAKMNPLRKWAASMAGGGSASGGDY